MRRPTYRQRIVDWLLDERTLLGLAMAGEAIEPAYPYSGDEHPWVRLAAYHEQLNREHP